MMDLREHLTSLHAECHKVLIWVEGQIDAKYGDLNSVEHDHVVLKKHNGEVWIIPFNRIQAVNLVEVGQ